MSLDNSISGSRWLNKWVKVTQKLGARYSKSGSRWFKKWVQATQKKMVLVTQKLGSGDSLSLSQKVPTKPRLADPILDRWVSITNFLRHLDPIFKSAGPNFWVTWKHFLSHLSPLFKSLRLKVWVQITQKVGPADLKSGFMWLKKWVQLTQRVGPEIANRQNTRVAAFDFSKVSHVMQSRNPASVMVFTAVASDCKVMPPHLKK